MRRRYITFRVTDAEYQILKSLAEQLGASVPVAARRRALDSVQIGQRLDAIEHRIEGLPDRQMMVEIARRLAERIDRAAGAKGVVS